MSIYRELAYDRVISGIKGIQFCVLSEQDIRRRSVVEVTENQTFQGNEPVVNGLFDTRMGVIDGNRKCATCQQDNKFCPGHFGHIVLERPVFYVQFFDVVRKLMKCVCFRSSRILVDLDGAEARLVLGRKISRQKRWDAMSKLCAKVRRCGQDSVDGCGAKVPDKVVKTDDMRLRLVWKDASDGAAASAEGATSAAAPREVVFNAEDVLRALRRVTDADCEALGFSAEHNRPERMVCTVLPVPPPAVRPSVRHDTGQRQEDDLTHKLSDIVKWNNFIRDKIARPGVTFDQIESYVPLLQYHVATLIDNSMPSMYPSKDRAGRMFRTLTERLRHKEGRIRGNLMGKRVDFSARTVITPDPNLSIDELGVPLKIAMNLTFPEVVGARNRAELQRLVLAGPDRYPGAKQVRKADGNRWVRLRGHPDPASIVLDDGDVVERHLRNGDYVLFNRQPSLHKMSMMAHRVRVMKYNTFRLNVCVCASYNADFDGDEMNMHVPQSRQTAYEIQKLAAVPLHVLSPRYSRPIITIVQDVALGVFRISQPNVRITQRQMFNLACGNQLLGASSGSGGVVSAPLPAPKGDGRDPWSASGRAAWTGREALSTVLPPTANVQMRSGRDRDDPKFDADVDVVRIEGGQIVSGVLTGDCFSAASRGLVHSTYNTLGPEAVVAMLNSTQKLICDWLVLSGFSVGISDIVIRDDTRVAKAALMSDAKARALAVLRSVHEGTFENISTRSDADKVEEEVMAALQKGSDAADKLTRLKGGFDIANNRMLNMIVSGSKGKVLNFQQMTACLGSQSIEGKRVPDGFDSRTLPHFTKYDDGPEARGFVEHSFMEGLTPHEFFFHSMAGRIGLIDTAVRTSETGYLQRRLVKAMEDCKIHHDLTVRNANNFVVQFLYGEDGMDAVKLEFQELPTVGKDPKDLRGEYLICDARAELSAHLTAEAAAALPGGIEARCEAHFLQLLDDRREVILGLHGGFDVSEPIVYPVNVRRIVETAAELQREAWAQHGGGSGGGSGGPGEEAQAQRSDLDPAWVLDRVEQLSAELRIGSEAAKGVGWLPVLLRCFLSPKPLIRRHRLTRASFERVADQIRRGFFEAVASPGEMTGIVAAQSIGEPATQLSVPKGTRTQLLRTAGGIYDGAIGPFVDGLMEVSAASVVDLGGGSSVLDLAEDVFIVGVGDDERTRWRRISQVSRHPANGGMVRVKTMSGKTTTATLSHSFLKRAERGIVPVLGSDLAVGDRIPVARSVPMVDADKVKRSVRIGDRDVALSRDFGWLCGAYVADGHVVSTTDVVSISKVIPEYQNKLRQVFADVFGLEMKQNHKKVGGTPRILHGWDMSKYPGCDNYVSNAPLARFMLESFDTGSHDKRLPPWIYAADLDFVRGVLCGYFDGDGSVNGVGPKSMIRSASVSEKLTEDVVLLLTRVGIFASKCVERHLKEPERGDLHTVQIARKRARRFRDEVGPLVVKHKAAAVDQVIDYVEREDAHNSQEFIDKIPELGGLLAAVGKALRMPGQSRLYRRFVGKESIGRETLREYVARFEGALAARRDEARAQRLEFAGKFAAMRGAIAAAAAMPLNGRVGGGVDHRGVMAASEPMLRELCDARTRLLGNKALGAANLVTCASHGRITASLFASHVDALELAADAALAGELAALDDVRDDKLPALRTALDADVVWDEIVELERLPDPGEMVYDFTVPGNDSFMVDCGVLVHNTLNSVAHGTELLLVGGVPPPRPPCPPPAEGAPPSAEGAPSAAGAPSALGQARCLWRTTIGDFVDARIEAAEKEEREAAAAKGGGERRAARTVLDDALEPLPFAGMTDDISPLVPRELPPSADGGAPSAEGGQGGLGGGTPPTPIERHPNDTTLLWLKEGGDDGPVHSGVEVLSVDEDGRVAWKEVTAVTRHPVVNKDGSDTLIEVTTDSGRSVVATKGKSFLTRRGNKLVATDGEDLRVGDHLPVTRVLPLPEGVDRLTHLDVDRYLPRTEFMYERELRRAEALWTGSLKRKPWFHLNGSPGAFTLPHARGDTVQVCAKLNADVDTEEDRKFREGCVYPKKLGPFSGGHVPERLPLDALFGFYCGAYLAEGSEGNSQIHISNVDEDYQARVQRFAEQFGIKWHVQDNSNHKGRSEDVCLHSKVLSDLTVRMFGRGAENKRIAPELLAANDEFLKGLVDGYFSGDGTFSGRTYNFSVSSASRGLIDDVGNVLLRFDVGSRVRTVVSKKPTTEKGSPILDSHKLEIRNGDAKRFGDTFTLTKSAKQACLESMMRVNMMDPHRHTPEDIVPALELPASGATVDAVHRDDLPRLLASLSDASDRAAVEAAMAEDVWYDRVVSIREVPNPAGRRYVYDLTVRDTRNFAIASGLMQRDTFHLSGSASSSKVTSGVPRMKELMSMSKNVKTPSMSVALRREWATSQERAQAVLSSIEMTHFRDLVRRSSVHFDPENGGATSVAEDAGMMAFYREFGGAACDARASPWLLRFEFDRMKMLDLKVSMLDIEATLVSFYDDTVTCVLSDDNAELLVCRLRLAALPAESSDLLTEVKALEQSIMESLVVKGVKGIAKAVPVAPGKGAPARYDAAADAFLPADEWTINTAGSNLVEVMGHPCVDYARTTTNDVHEVYLTLGIEAASQVLLNEMRVVLGNNSQVDHRHLSLLTATMSNRGFFMSIDRHGINNRGELGPLAKCSFEQTTDMLIKAGVFAERDRINGVSANIMLGQVAPCGTGDFEVLMDGRALVEAAVPGSAAAAAQAAQAAKAQAKAKAHANSKASAPGDGGEDDEEGGRAALPEFAVAAPGVAAADAVDADAAGEQGGETTDDPKPEPPRRRKKKADDLVIT